MTCITACGKHQTVNYQSKLYRSITIKYFPMNWGHRSRQCSLAILSSFVPCLRSENRKYVPVSTPLYTSEEHSPAGTRSVQRRRRWRCERLPPRVSRGEIYSRDDRGASVRTENIKENSRATREPPPICPAIIVILTHGGSRENEYIFYKLAFSFHVYSRHPCKCKARRE